MPAGILRWGARGGARRYRVVVGAVYVVRARWRTPWGTYSPWSGTVDFGVSIAGSLPVARLDPLTVVWDQPLTRWSWYDVDGDVQTDYQIQLATNTAFSPTVLDTGTVTSTAMQYQHSGLTANAYYRRLRVRTGGVDWSAWVQDSFVFQAATSQATDFSLYRVHSDGVKSQIFVPLSGVEATRRLDGASEFKFTFNNFMPFVERALEGCWHFDEISGAVAHDIVNPPYSLALVGSPAWTSAVINLAGDDYGDSGNVSLDLSSDYSIFLLAYPSGTSGTLLYLGAYANNTNYAAVQYNLAGKVRIAVNGATSADLTVDAASWVVLRLKRVGTTLTLTRLDTGTSVTLAGGSPTGTPRISVGHFAGLTPSGIVNAGKVAGLLLYSDDPTAAEDAQNLAAYRANWIHRGVTVL